MIYICLQKLLNDELKPSENKFVKMQSRAGHHSQVQVDHSSVTVGIQERESVIFPRNGTPVSALSALAADATRQLNVLGHDRNTLGVNGAQVGVLKEANEVGLRSFLKGKNGSTLETKVGLEILSNLTDQTLERSLANEKIGRLLVLANLTQSDSSWAVTVGLLDASGSGSTLASSLSSW